MVSSRWPVTLAWYAVAIAGGAARAQEVTLLPEKHACPTCSIIMHSSGHIGAESGPHLLDSPPMQVLSTPSGRRYVITEQTRSEVQAFDARGRSIQTVGRSGEGPGEFKRITVISLIGDSLIVFDGSNGRVSVWGSNGAVVREHPLRLWVDDMCLLSSGDFVLAANMATRDLVGLPLHIANRAGKVLRSFGTDAPAYRGDASQALSRVLAGAGASFWAARRTAYVLEEWSADGGRVRSIERRAKWFPPYMKRLPPTPRRPPYPSVRDIQVDGQGRIWVALHVSDPDYRKALASTPTIAEGVEVYKVTGTLDELYDTRIEVIDPRTGSIVTSARHDAVAISWSAPGQLALYRETRGYPEVQLINVTLSRRRERQ